MKKKISDITDLAVVTEEGATYITGYANTKNVPDSYGDIPYNLNGEPVYDLVTRFALNPVALVDHTYSVGHIFGVFIVGPGKTYEDERGLKFTLRLMDNPKTLIAQHAVEAYKTGFARALSIGGEWVFNDENNRSHLTKAIIHEISGVAIGADRFALTEKPYVKDIQQGDQDAQRWQALEMLISEYRKAPCDLLIKGIQTLKGVK